MNYDMPFCEKEFMISEIADAIRKATKRSTAQLHQPVFNGNEWLYLKDCLDSSFVSSVGTYVSEFEKKIAQYTGAVHAIATVNGTAALHLALIVAGVNADEEVLVPSMTFVATANAVSYVNAKPHFIDCSEKNFGIDPILLRAHLEKISEVRNGICINKETGRIIRALVPMHVFGHPCDIIELKEIADEFQIIMIEDAAESLGSFYREKHTGTFGRMGVISFNGNKTITTGGGGVIITNDDEIAESARFLSTTAKEQHPYAYVHTKVGYNYRMPNLNAALGCAQLEELPKILRSKRKLTSEYKNAFSRVKNIQFLDDSNFPDSNFWLQTLLLNENYSQYRDAIIEGCIEAGFQVRPAWSPIHSLPMYSNLPSTKLSNTINLSKRIINLPSGMGLT
jgi:perosamine synthetase